MKNKKLYVNLAYVAYDTTFSIANNTKKKKQKTQLCANIRARKFRYWHLE